MRTLGGIQFLVVAFSFFLLSGCDGKDKDPDTAVITDYRDKYTGDWAFKVKRRIDEAGIAVVNLDDSVYIVGKIIKGTLKNSLYVSYFNPERFVYFVLTDPSNISYIDGFNEYL